MGSLVRDLLAPTKSAMEQDPFLAVSTVLMSVMLLHARHVT